LTGNDLENNFGYNSKPLKMKTKGLFLLIGLFMLTNNYAQKIVALHSATGVQFFSDDNPLQSAYTAAVDNDTIYLPGGSFAVPQKFDKKLRIIGAGHNPSATDATWKTILSGNIVLGSNADGFYLEGIQGNEFYFETDQSINNVIIQRCKLNNIYINGNLSNPSENCIFRESIMHSLNIGNLLNSSFFNNIIEDRINSARNLTFLNNIFLYAYHYDPVFNYANNCMIKNNIFLQTDGHHGIADGAGQSTYSHNIVCFAFDPNNTSSFGTDPILDTNYSMTRADVLVNQTGGTFDYTHDYHLQTAAQSNIGDDGTIVGIYGGFYPWKDASIPSNPHISSKNISNTTSATGTIHIDLNVQAQDR
jgi:hypothetical protein